MKINWLPLLMVLVAMQSTMAVADLHQAYQTGQEHISFNHTDDITSHPNSDQPDTQTNFETESDLTASYDCHHCCHCHGVACHYLLKDDTSFVLYQDNDAIFESFNLYNTRIISPDLRPPKV